MHVEFKLPSGAGGQAAHYSCTVLNRELARWSDLYGFHYETQITYYRMTVRFQEDHAVTMFALCWPVTQIKWEIRED